MAVLHVDVVFRDAMAAEAPQDRGAHTWQRGLLRRSGSWRLRPKIFIGTSSAAEVANDSCAKRMSVSGERDSRNPEAPEGSVLARMCGGETVPSQDDQHARSGGRSFAART